tara:strand:- start:37 stop:552 length:516 start_codon:yes stop_codon:yes gene_type:complete
VAQQTKGDYSMAKREDPIFITGECNWAFLKEPNRNFSDDQHPPIWTIDVDVNDENRSTIEAAGLKIKSKEGRNDFVTVKRKIYWPNGNDQTPPDVIDSAKIPWGSKKVGNGSVVSVKAVPFNWNFNGKSGRGADLEKVQILDLVPYEDDTEDFHAVEGGYVQEVESDSAPF